MSARKIERDAAYFAARTRPVPAPYGLSEPCRIWTLRIGADGYGDTKHGGRTISAHRLAYAVYVGPIPPGLWVLHACDTPACCEPSHLRLGDVSDNARDRETRGRGVRHTGADHYTAIHPEKRQHGERHGRSKLTDMAVRCIRADDRRHGTIAMVYGVSRPTVSIIKSRRTWSHIG